MHRCDIPHPQSEKQSQELVSDLSLRLEILLEDIMSRPLLAPIPDHTGGTLDHLPGLPLAVNLAQAGPLAQGLGGLPHTTGQAVGYESLLEDLLDGGVDVHGTGGRGGGWNVISLIVRHCEFLDD